MGSAVVDGSIFPDLLILNGVLDANFFAVRSRLCVSWASITFNCANLGLIAIIICLFRPLLCVVNVLTIAMMVHCIAIAISSGAASFIVGNKEP